MRAWAVLAALLAAGCGAELHRRANDIEYLRGIVHLLDCGDTRPARVLIDPACRDGICGISCAPDRWATDRRH